MADALLRFPLRTEDEKDKFRAKNGQIFYCLQNSWTSASLVGLNFFSILLYLH